MPRDEFLDFPAFVRLIVDALDAAEVEYMIGGGLAVWAWGEIRTTQDLDVVIYIPDAQIERFSQELFKREMAVPPDIMRDLIADPRGDLPINAIHGFSGFKADLFPIRERDDFRRLALQRRQKVDLGDEIGIVYVHSPEDLILYKLQYYAISRQTKHVRDIQSMLKRVESLDRAYIDQWAARLNVLPIWHDMQSASS
jgi:hypothetical protein